MARAVLFSRDTVVSPLAACRRETPCRCFPPTADIASSAIPFLPIRSAGPRMSSAIQVAKTVTYLPDLVEVQRASFKWFLEKGLIEELDSFLADH